LRFIVWSFLKARLQFTLDQFNGATSPIAKSRTGLFVLALSKVKQIGPP